MFRKVVFLGALVWLIVVALAATDLTAQKGKEEVGPPQEGEAVGPSKEDEEAGSLKRIVPHKTRVLVGLTRQFRTVGIPDAVTWAVVDSSDEEVGTIDTTGLFTALKGGWVIIGVKDPQTGDVLASTDTVWVMGGPTKVDRRGGRVFAASDTFVVVHFPPDATERAMTVLIEKRGIHELPEKAKGRGVAVAVFEFTAVDAETGEDVGKKGFKAKVRLTLHYNDEDIPEGVAEEDLVVATFDEDEEEWKVVPEEAVVEVDLEANTITVETDHASLWAVMDETSLAVPVRSNTWGKVKAGFAR